MKIIHYYGTTYFQWLYFGLFILVADKRFEFIGLFETNRKIISIRCMKFGAMQMVWTEKMGEKRFSLVFFIYILLFLEIYFEWSYFELDWRFWADKKINKWKKVKKVKFTSNWIWFDDDFPLSNNGAPSYFLLFSNFMCWHAKCAHKMYTYYIYLYVFALKCSKQKVKWNKKHVPFIEQSFK